MNQPFNTSRGRRLEIECVESRRLLSASTGSEGSDQYVEVVAVSIDTLRLDTPRGQGLVVFSFTDGGATSLRAVTNGLRDYFRLNAANDTVDSDAAPRFFDWADLGDFLLTFDRNGDFSWGPNDGLPNGGGGGFNQQGNDDPIDPIDPAAVVVPSQSEPGGALAVPLIGRLGPASPAPEGLIDLAMLLESADSPAADAPERVDRLVTFSPGEAPTENSARDAALALEPWSRPLALSVEGPAPERQGAPLAEPHQAGEPEPADLGQRGQSDPRLTGAELTPVAPTGRPARSAEGDESVADLPSEAPHDGAAPLAASSTDSPYNVAPGVTRRDGPWATGWAPAALSSLLTGSIVWGLHRGGQGDASEQRPPRRDPLVWRR